MFTDDDCVPILEELRKLHCVAECAYISLIACIYKQAQHDALATRFRPTNNSTVSNHSVPTEKDHDSGVDFCVQFEDDIVELALRGGVRIPKNFSKRTR